MIRYLYNHQCNPPAPFIHVTVRNLERGEECGELPAQLDTAADFTVIPGKVAQALQLAQIDQIAVAGLEGRVSSLPMFSVQIRPRKLDPVEVKVLASVEEPYVLLGRDVLNQYQVFLYGRDLAFEIG